MVILAVVRIRESCALMMFSFSTQISYCSSGISTGAIIGIVVAVVVGLAVAALIAFFVWRRKKKANREEGVWSDKAPSIHGASPQPYMYSQAPSGSQSALPTSPSQYPGSVPSQYGGQTPSQYGGQPPSQYGGQAYDTRSYAAPSFAQGQPPAGGAPTSQTGSSSNIYNPWSDVSRELLLSKSHTAIQC